MVTLRSLATALASAALFIPSSIGQFAPSEPTLPQTHTPAAHSQTRNPVSDITLLSDPLIKAPKHRIRADSNFDLTFSLNDEPIRLALEPNHDILHDDFAVTYIGQGGEVRETEVVPRTTHKIFRGRAFVQRSTGWTQAGWARITMHKDGKDPLFEGAFRVFGDSHHIQTVAHWKKTKHAEDPVIDVENEKEAMVVYRDSDIKPSSSLVNGELKRRSADDSKCDSDSLDFNHRYDGEMRKRELEERSLASINTRHLFGRQSIDSDIGDDAGANYIPNIGSTSGCPSTRKVALVGIATDCNYWEEFDEDREAIRSNVIDLVNRASALYEDTFSISLGIRNLTVIDQACNEAESESAPWNLACSDRVNLNDRLNLFSQWRGNHNDNNAYWTLLTTCNTDSAVGLAWRGQLCREGASDATDSGGRNETIAATNVVVRTSAEWQIFAHETGHTFGAVHDCTESDCPVSQDAQPCCPLSADSCDANGRFIMNPSTGERIEDFSRCSIGNICSGLLRNVDGECLTDNRNVGTITGSQCGNGIVEEGEDCDCGGADDCDDNDCCNPETCEFRDGAQCDPTNEDCCNDQCEFASSGTVCRASTGDCDPEETCPGDSGNCPSDNHLDDGDSCGDGLSCASGQCTSRNMQCRAMLGDGNEDNEDITACGGDTCMLSCESPNYDGQCAVYNQNFLDGTGCGGGGRCENGVCNGGSTWGRIQQWFRDNRHIAIPVGCVIGGLLLLAISCCIFSSCRKRRRASKRKKAAAAAASAAPAMTGGNGPPVGGYWQPQTDHGPRGGNVNTSEPFMNRDQPQTHVQNDWQYPDNNSNLNWQQPGHGRWGRTNSMRYA